MWFHKT